MSGNGSKVGTLFRILMVRLRFIGVFVVVGLIVGNWQWIQNRIDRWTRPPKSAAATQGEFEWFCPMHPTVVRGEPGNCPICGMPLSKRKRGEKVELSAGVVSRQQLSPFRIRQAGVATEEIGYRDLVREIRTVGTVQYDERRLSHLSARIAGRVDKLFVNFTGGRVKAGDPVYSIYSPDLVTTQEEYLLALKALDEIRSQLQHDDGAVGRAERLAASARERLRLWGVTDAQVAELEGTRKAPTHLTVYSPISGVVIEKEIHAGHYVQVGEDPYTIADDAQMWMMAEIFERDLGLVKEGEDLAITSEAYPGETFTGKVAYLQPDVRPETRTVRARVDVANLQGKLKTGMFVTAILRVPVGRRGEVYYGCCANCPGVRSDQPGKCSLCSMELTKQGGVAAAEKAAAGAGDFIYKCTMDAGVRDTPGSCPVCGMTLDDRFRAPRAPSEPPAVPVKELKELPKAVDAPVEVRPQGHTEPPVAAETVAEGPASSTAAHVHESAEPAPEHAPDPEPSAERTVYVCPVHPEEVFDKPGKCGKGSCNGMPLEPLVIKPGSRLVYACPEHPEVVSDKPGKCPKNGKALQYKVVSDAVQLAETWACARHPVRTAEGLAACPDCGKEMKHFEFEKELSVPASAVIDTGTRRVVFVDRGHETYEGVEVELGPRAGEYFQVLKGLAAGDRVVTAGAFLLDAEARLNPAAGAQYFGASGSPAAAGHEGHKSGERQ